jgi:hypothetical protein
MKLLKTEFSFCLIQRNNELLVFQEHSVNTDDLNSCSSDDFDCEAQIKMIGKNQIEILQLQELYQFNCCRSLLNIIKLLDFGLSLNGYSPSSVKPYFEKPESYKESIISSTKITQQNTHGPGADYSFVFKGTTVIGSSSYIKYTFFQKIESLPSTLSELFALYVDLNKLIAQACHEAQDKNFMPCDDWATLPYGNEDKYRKRERD